MYIHVHSFPKARTEKVIEKSPDHFDIHVREVAERNMANMRICELVAGHFGVSRGNVRIINGHHSTSKLLSINTGED
jgi:uncharacterized protein YggU (UPF0235/DUF167 family)